MGGMISAPLLSRKEVVHALTSSKLFRKEARIRSSIITDRQLSWFKKDMSLLVIERDIEDLAVVQRHNATIVEIQEAFEALGGRSWKKSSTFSEPWW